MSTVARRVGGDELATTDLLARARELAAERVFSTPNQRQPDAEPTQEAAEPFDWSLFRFARLSWRLEESTRQAWRFSLQDAFEEAPEYMDLTMPDPDIILSLATRDLQDHVAYWVHENEDAVLAELGLDPRETQGAPELTFMKLLVGLALFSEDEEVLHDVATQAIAFTFGLLRALESARPGENEDFDEQVLAELFDRLEEWADAPFTVSLFFQTGLEPLPLEKRWKLMHRAARTMEEQYRQVFENVD